MREIKPGTIRCGPFTYEYEHEISTVLSIVMFPIIMISLISFYVIIGMCMVLGTLFKSFKILLEKMNEQRRETL